MSEPNQPARLSDAREYATVRERLSAFAKNASLMDGVGVVAAAVLFVCVNVLAARFFERWDATSTQLFTLSEPTRGMLARLQQPLDVIVLLSRTDPLNHTVSKVLDEYRAVSPYVQPKFVDPDRNPAEFVALRQQYGLQEGRTEDGRLASEASIVLVQGGQHWFVTTDDIVAYDEQTDSATPRLEQVLTEGIARVVGQRRRIACFTKGHQELSVESGGPQGQSEFRRQLERNNYEVQVVDLGLAQLDAPLRSCDVVVAVGATQPYSAAAADVLNRYVANGGGLLLAVGPLTDDDGRIIDPGLGPLLDPLGIRASDNVVFEGEPALSMPIGIGGEVFLASPRAHAVTSGMLHGDQVVLRVLLQLAQSFELTSSSIASVLLESSPQATALTSFRGLANAQPAAQSELRKVYAMAVAAEHPSASAGLDPNRQPRRGRVVAVGTPSVLWSSTWREAALLGTRRFVESALAWVTAEQPLISVPEKPTQPAGLSLTASGMSEVRRYVLLYLPLGVALIGVLLMWGRRREGRARPTEES